jgi:uncharacterized membrane protein YbhN (UPF0104 family)
MESIAPDRWADSTRSARSIRWNLAKIALGLALVGALILSGQIDLHVLVELASRPWAVAASLALLFLTLPIVALRWMILLRALGLSIRFGPVFHFVAIAVLANAFLLGVAGGDAVRGLYAWRAVGGNGAIVTMSVVIDRALSLCAILLIGAVALVFNWGRVIEEPVLVALATSVVLTLAAAVVGACLLLAAPGLLRSLGKRLPVVPRLAGMIGEATEVVLRLRNNLAALLAAFALALSAQLLSIAAVVVVAMSAGIGSLGVSGLSFAVPLTLLANSWPITPSGLGVGEAAFAQLCRWLEAAPSGAAYSSIFFGYRLISTLVCVPGLVSLVVYRRPARRGSARG